MKSNHKTGKRYDHPRHSEKLNDLLYEVRMTNDGDSWGTCMSWLFSVCDWLYENGENGDLTDRLEYSPGAMGPACEGYDFDSLNEIGDQESIEELGEILARWRSMLRAAGQDY